MNILQQKLELLNNQAVQQRFWSNVVKAEQNACWIWKGSIAPNFYGRFHIENTYIIANRASWYLTHGPIPKNMLICHSCDTPLCVNPHHLFLGNAKDNRRDTIEKGRLRLEGSEQKRLLKLWQDAQVTPDPQKEERDRFWQKVNKDTENGCWLWLGKPNPKGYGRFGSKHKVILAHRYCWQITNGEIPDGLSLCHHCDIPACVNPSHLFLGTIADNNTDMHTKGRGYILPAKVNKTSYKVGEYAGEKHFKAKLTERDVRDARELRKQGWTITALADTYSIRKSSMRNALIGKTWSHIT